MNRITKQIKKHLDIETSRTHRRKPIFLYCKTRAEAETVYRGLKENCKDISKILLVADEQDFADRADQISKQTVLVMSDELKLCPVVLPFSVVPMLVNYSLPADY